MTAYRTSPTTRTRKSSTIKLPWERTERGCKVRVEILDADDSETPVHDIWDRGMTLVSRCLIHSDSIGGKIVVDDEAGLTVSIRPEGDDEGDWELRFEKGSVVVGEEKDFKPIFFGSACGGEGGGERESAGVVESV